MEVAVLFRSSLLPHSLLQGCEFVIEITCVLIDFSLTVKAATLIVISRRDSAISSAKEGTSGFINNLVKS